MHFLRLLFTPRGLFAATGLASLGLIAGALVLVKTMNLAACPLCILQRMLYLLLALEAIVAWILANPARPTALPRRAAALVMAVTALTGTGIATYQMWLQRFAKGVSCTADQPWWERLVDWAGSQWPLMFEASGLCSEAGWKFLGLSIAEWSLIAFACMSIAMVIALLRKA
ncbi:MAG: disulfide bond formation protein B [Rhodocyclaceae bacterium]|nr:MAG: disulfide bond formation protein B [Rhodocyclaceae bacterium]